MGTATSLIPDMNMINSLKNGKDRSNIEKKNNQTLQTALLEIMS